MVYKVISSYNHGNEQALRTMREIEALVLPKDEVVEIDFQDFGENTPFNVLAIANTLKHYRAQHPEHEFTLIPKKSNDYLSHLGFYQMIGARVGKAVGEAQASSNYVPIKEIEFNASFYATIEPRARELARLLSFDKSLEKFVSYMFVETIRNVYEHADVLSAFICAQKWPSKNLVEIAIADTGIGIADSLGKSFPQKSEIERMYLSMQPGITSKSNYSYLEKNDPWRNSGYGLYTMQKLAFLYGGSFLLCSGKCALLVSQNGTKEYETAYHGTAIAIRFKSNTNNDFNKLRREVISTGQNEAFWEPKAIKRASKSSGGHYNG